MPSHIFSVSYFFPEPTRLLTNHSRSRHPKFDFKPLADPTCSFDATEAAQSSNGRRPSFPPAMAYRQIKTKKKKGRPGLSAVSSMNGERGVLSTAIPIVGLLFRLTPKSQKSRNQSLGTNHKTGSVWGGTFWRFTCWLHSRGRASNQSVERGCLPCVLCLGQHSCPYT